MAFKRSLEDLLGEGALLIEDRVLKNLYAKLGLEYYEDEKLTFSECIERALTEYARKQEEKNEKSKRKRITSKTVSEK